MRPMKTLQDVIEEAKVRTLLWAICVFGISYFLSHTSKSMWTNIPISVLIFSAFRYLSYEVELRWRVRPSHRQSYLSHLEKKQLSVNDSRLSTAPPMSKWRQKIDSPPVEAAVDDFINKILQDFVVDLWYSSITPDKEAPALIRTIILDVLGEISGRIKEINLVDLLTRDVVDLVGNHLDLYRKNQLEIGVDVMGTLSFEGRDDKLKCHLIASKELHPALISPECEHKVLQRIVGGMLAIVMRPQEAKCPLARCISRELLTCLVLQPVMNLASPAYINELIEYVFLASKDNSNGDRGGSTSSHAASSVQDPSRSGELESIRVASCDQSSDIMQTRSGEKTSEDSHHNVLEKDSVHDGQSRPADWALILEAATKRRSQVLAPENLENMWTKGRNYKKKSVKAGTSSVTGKTSGVISSTDQAGHAGKELMISKSDSTVREQATSGRHFDDEHEENTSKSTRVSTSQLKRSSSTSDVNVALMRKTNSMDLKEPSGGLTSHSEGSSHASKLRCRVVGAYFEKIGSKSFAVYSIAVTDADNKTWFVKRRYRNFERLHRHLKEIPNYSLHLPPKRFLSSSIDDYFVHQRCILLDRYLQDLLSISNVAEQHEVWDFLSASSKNYSFGKSTSVMKTLAVNVDDAMDDIVRQFKGVSDGLMRKVVGSSPPHATSPQMAERRMALTWHDEEINKNSLSYSNIETSRSISDDEAQDEDHSAAVINGWHSDNELNSKGFPPRVVKRMNESRSLDSRKSQQPDQLDKFLSSKSAVASSLDDPAGMPPEWTPPNVSVPLLNLVDKMFQLNRRGWLRRQVFWISKQILQLMMEDAIDDWILRQIHCLRNDEVIAHGIRWVHNVLWPNGIFFIKLRSMPAENTSQTSNDEPAEPSSFELHLEAARRASDVKKMILGGAPTALVSLIGNRQYRKCAKDIYYFLQSTICVKQLAYSTLELLLISVFPELQELIQDIHEKARAQSVYDK